MRVRRVETQGKSKRPVTGCGVDEVECLLACVASEVNCFPIELLVFLVETGVVRVVVNPENFEFIKHGFRLRHPYAEFADEAGVVPCLLQKSRVRNLHKLRAQRVWPERVAVRAFIEPAKETGATR